MFADFQDLIALLNKHNAKYLVIGGYAVSRHAQPRDTKDLDIFILPVTDNAKAVFAALREFGAPLISRDDLIAAKLAAGRDQDLVDVKALRKAAASEMTGAPKPTASAKPRKSRKK